MTIRIENSTHEECVLAAGVVGKTKVVSCPNPADGASPVYLHAGEYGRSLGQSADYRHDLDSLVGIHDAALVQSWWDNDAQQWDTTIDGLDQHDSPIRDFIHASQAKQAARESAERRESSEAARQQEAAAEKSRIADAMEVCRQVAEEWAPGRVAVKMANDREIIVGRWDAPFVPGHGLPGEVRRVIRGEGAQPELVACNESYRYTFS